MWNITGTASQQEISRAALADIKFPFDRLTLPGSPELGWADLNSGMFRMHDDHAHTDDEGGHGEGDAPEPLVGRLEGRRFVMGVFYPYSARIYVDHRLEPYPEIAKAVIAAEIGHAVDEFLPLSDGQRALLMAMLHPDGADDHSWWEKSDYSAEYYSLVGETFMILFTKAYSDLDFGDTADFVHSGANVTPEQIRAAVGVERTDAPPPTIPFVRYGTSKVYHRPTHKVSKKAPTEVTTLDGLRPCKVCKP